MNTEINSAKQPFFLIRIILAILFVGFPMAITIIIKNILKSHMIFDFFWIRTIYTLVLISVVYMGYALYTKKIEKRKPVEYSIKHCKKELLQGLGLGAGLITLQVVFLWIIDVYQIQGMAFSVGIIRFFLLNLFIGFFEELISRGILFRILEEGLGSWIAIIISSLEVGLTHMTNSGSSILSTFAVGIEFGLMLTLLYMITRRLWVITGFHFAWNFTMGGIFGINVSGMELSGLLQTNLEGPAILTGGQWGIEAGLPAILICSGISIYLLIRIIRENKIVQPKWKQNKSKRI